MNIHYQKEVICGFESRVRGGKGKRKREKGETPYKKARFELGP
jgi:hypothetical protein